MPVPNDALGPLRYERVRWGAASGVRRVVLIFAAVGMIAGVGLLTAGFALAANGSEPGHLSLTPASGNLTVQPTWSTTDGCPSGNDASAVVEEFNPDGSPVTRISGVVNSPTAAIHNATFLSNVGDLLSSTNLVPTTGGTVEWAVGCYSAGAGTGNVKYVQSIFVTEFANGTFSTSVTATPTSTPTHTASATPTSTPSHTPTSTPTSTASATPSPTSTLPSGAPGTGAGGASLPGRGSGLLTALGAVALAGSAAAIGVAMRRPRKLTEQIGQGDGKPGAS